MECLKGKSVYKGVAFGKISVLKKDDYVVKRVKIEDTQAELQRVEEAVEASKPVSYTHLLRLEIRAMARGAV